MRDDWLMCGWVGYSFSLSFCGTHCWRYVDWMARCDLNFYPKTRVVHHTICRLFAIINI